MTVDTCVNCKNYLGGFSCLAFDTIPEEILKGENGHEKPLKGQDNDIVYEEKKDGDNIPTLKPK